MRANLAGQCAVILGVIATAGTVVAQKIDRPEVPEELKAPAGEEVVLRAHATGVQIYSCLALTGGKFSWELKGPKAQLFDEQGKLIGEHFAGPTWRLKDGSEVKGKAVAKQNAIRPNAIPWLLVTVTDHKGSGILSHVTTIQRLNTDGGTPGMATICDETKGGTEVQSSYSADYYFYAPQK